MYKPVKIRPEIVDGNESPMKAFCIIPSQGTLNNRDVYLQREDVREIIDAALTGASTTLTVNVYSFYGRGKELSGEKIIREKADLIYKPDYLGVMAEDDMMVDEIATTDEEVLGLVQAMLALL